MTAPPPLAYAPRPPLLRRRWTTWALIAAAVLTVAAVSPHWWPPLSRHVRLLYWQHRCLTHPIAGGTIVWQCRDFSHQIHKQSSDWLTFYTLLSPPGGLSEGSLFVHQMRRPDGQQRLVEVDIQMPDFTSDDSMYTSYRVLKPGTLFNDPVEVTILDGHPSLENSLTELHAADLDPQDPTHFTFDGNYLGRKREQFDGWLTNADQIIIQRRRRPDEAVITLSPPPAGTAATQGPGAPWSGR